MGCLNDDKNFDHWFGNIHLSGPCNRSCYFCIGQHMMALDPLNNLDTWPLEGMGAFVRACWHRGPVTDINVTGSNTDPLMYRHTAELCELLRIMIPGVKIGIRTNGSRALEFPEVWRLYDKASITMTSFDQRIYIDTMGPGWPPDIAGIMAIKPLMPVKVNIPLCPALVDGDLPFTLDRLAALGIRRVNIRELYGQPHVGDPLAGETLIRTVFGMPVYRWGPMEVTYWDVHYVEVKSINLYANGVVSDLYPVTKGYDPSGDVKPQSEFKTAGRIAEQWIRRRP